MCKQHTNLTEDEIEEIEELSKHLQTMAKLNEASIFIDCPTENNKHIIVVAEASPDQNNMLYHNSVIKQNAYERFEPAVFEVFKTKKSVYHHRGMSQEGKVIEQNVTPIIYNNRVIAALIMEKDISNQLLEENKMKALTEATYTLSQIVSHPSEKQLFFSDMIDESLFDIDQDLIIRYFNLTAEKLVKDIVGIDCKMGLSFVDLFPNIEEMLTDGKVITIKERKLQGHYFQVKCIRLFDDLGNVSGHIIMLHDITDLKEKEKELISKSVALREVHHRVKNNLQTVASLLRLQMRRGIPEESKHYFEESLNRILSIASVYEVILDGAYADQVDIGKLIIKIGNMLVSTGNAQHLHIHFDIQESFYLSSNIAVSVALIANELITNCVTHAFNHQEEGHIDVIFEKNNKTGKLVLMVQDDGQEEQGNYKQSFGLNIINTITENDLEGQFTIGRNHLGTLGKVVFDDWGSR
ncbi:sensor histidine kinase [Staphylococcus piscifermentans]|uniref:sensor histidine kinase n=1 Tax=Staphylococcus piscifermentans TaxID=70258 RepID=UPI001F483E92|nr:sensor histidine kinase [Staphylococcus piscifermentans]